MCMCIQYNPELLYFYIPFVNASAVSTWLNTDISIPNILHLWYQEKLHSESANQALRKFYIIYNGKIFWQYGISQIVAFHNNISKTIWISKLIFKRKHLSLSIREDVVNCQSTDISNIKGMMAFPLKPIKHNTNFKQNYNLLFKQLY